MLIPSCVPIRSDLDWTLTTPTMILTLNVLIKAWADDCASTEDILTPAFVIGNVVAVVFNTFMLHGGYRVESGRVDNERESITIAMSTLWFFFAFLPSVIFVTESYSIHGLLVLLATWCIWALYAVNLYYNRADTETRASIYNLLDLLSKNGARLNAHCLLSAPLAPFTTSFAYAPTSHTRPRISTPSPFLRSLRCGRCGPSADKRRADLPVTRKCAPPPLLRPPR